MLDLRSPAAVVAAITLGVAVALAVMFAVVFGTSPAVRHPPPAPPAVPSPSAHLDRFGAPFDVDPQSSVATAVAEERDLTSTQRALLDGIAAQALAHWIASPEASVTREVHGIVSAARARGAIPVLVAYAIPGRDCGGYSAGGVEEAGYERWVDAFVAGLGRHPSIVIVEPDALAQLSCLDRAGAERRVAELAYAVDAFAAQGSFAYLDAGHSGWIDADDMARYLGYAHVSNAAGFSLNVSNFRGTAEEIAYGTTISDALGGAHFVIDTSRNGIPSRDDEWCNPSGRALGAVPTTVTASPLVDAYLWIKTPGRSDGPCRGGPPAGEWWPQYAIDLARNGR